jgi:dipeptidyl aminopeptidase/acylaminoacyl peptidase
MEDRVLIRESLHLTPTRPPLARKVGGWRTQAGFLLVAALLLAGCANSRATQSGTGETREEAVHFVSGNNTIAGTLVLPDGPQRHPAVVLFHGSGPQSRDLFTARWFGQQGFAALAYDKRGVGESTGNFRDVPFMELCDDGLAAIAYLKSRKEIDPKRIGVWGLSQGGWLGPLAASRSPDISFVIAVSGPGVSPGEQMIFFYAEELRAQGMPESDVAEASALRRDVWNYMHTGDSYEKTKGEIAQARSKPWYAGVKAQQDQLFDPLPPPAEIKAPVGRRILWFQHEMVYDPVPTLRALKVPALFLFGDEDRVTPVEESVAVLRQVQAESGKKNFTIQVFHGADHGMYLLTSGGARTTDPEYLETMRKWLRAHVETSR